MNLHRNQCASAPHFCFNLSLPNEVILINLTWRNWQTHIDPKQKQFASALEPELSCINQFLQRGLSGAHLLIHLWGYLSSLILFLFSYRIWRFSNEFKLLRNVSLSNRLEVWPKVSLIVPACNEAGTIEKALKSLLAMDYPNLELIVVDDRSVDGTNAIVKTLQLGDSRLQLVEVTLLPQGWLGKVHALDQGVRRATGDWLLFSDADVCFDDKSLKKSIHYVVQESIDFLTVIPGIRSRSLILKSLMVQFLQLVISTSNLKRLKQVHTTDCMGGGAFNLVSRLAYERSQGFEWLKLEVIDDTGLALAVKQAGAKCDALGGLGELELEWYPNFWAFVRGLEKNGFAIFQYSVVILSVYLIFNVLLFLGLILPAFLNGNPLLTTVTVASLVLNIFLSARALKKVLPFSPWVAVFVPLTNIVLPLIILRSAILFYYNRGIYWRGTFYSRDALITNQRFKLINLSLRGTFRGARFSARHK